MSMPTPDPVEVWNYPNAWFIAASVVILLLIWFSGSILTLFERIFGKQ